MTTPSHIVQCLAGTLSADANTRMSAELKLSELLVSPETGLSLSQLIQSQELDLPLRQMKHSATILLRKYVTQRWSPHFPTFKGSAPPVEVKADIREAVFRCLSDPNRRIRSICAHLLSTIADCDWPDEYPDLLTLLISLLSSGSPDSVHGSIQVFTEFIKSDITGEQLLPVLLELLPALLNILGSTDHTPLTRSRTISVFRQCVIALYMVEDQHPQTASKAIASVLPVWIEVFKVLLDIDPQEDVSRDNWDCLAIRIEVFKTLDTIYTSFPDTLAPYIEGFLNSSLYHLQTLSPTFSFYYLSSDQPVPSTSEDEPLELPQLACPVIDFLSSVTRRGKAETWYAEDDNLAVLLSWIFKWMQMSVEDEESWASDVNAFVAQEDDVAITQGYGVRAAAFDLLTCLVDDSPVQTTTAIASTIQRIVTESGQAREAGDMHWWKPLEAALAALGSQSRSVLDCIMDEKTFGRPNPIDIESLLRDVVPSVLGLSECPFLQGRGFVFSSNYAKLLPTQLAGLYLDAAIQVIEAPEAGIPIKVSAVKAVQNFCQNMVDSVIRTFAPRIAASLGSLLQTTGDALNLVLDTLSIVLCGDMGNWLTPELANNLTVAVLNIWARNIMDPLIASVLGGIFTSLAEAPGEGVYEVVIRQALPVLSSIMGSACPDEVWMTQGAVDLLKGILIGAPKAGLGDGFFSTLAPSLFSCLKATQDRDVLQNGVACLSAIIRKDVGQLLSWSDEGGRSGLDNIFDVIAKVLENQDESGGLYIGELIIDLFRRVGDAILPVLPAMLQAMVRRMSSAKTATFLQSLVIPFCFLINNQRDTVLSLLESTEVNGRSGLDIFVQTWCDNAQTFQGRWPKRISDLALSQIYLSERPSLQNLFVKGDIIVKSESQNGITTRSKSRTKTAHHQFTRIPFPAKAIKLLLRDLQPVGESRSPTPRPQRDGVSKQSNDDDEYVDKLLSDFDQAVMEDPVAFLSKITGPNGNMDFHSDNYLQVKNDFWNNMPKGMSFDSDFISDLDDDQEFEDDPVSQMDMQAHLTSFFRQCAARNTNNFSVMIEKLAPKERDILRKVVGE